MSPYAIDRAIGGHLGRVMVPALLALAATIYAVARYSPWLRPIWFDEFLQFAFAAAPEMGQAWAMIRASGESINHGQTGVLAIVQYASLSLFGASFWALRWPAFVATFCMFLGATMVFSRFRYAILWQIAIVLALSLQPDLMHYTGEARPYIILCAATSLVLAYYVAPGVARKKTGYRLAGYGGVAAGVLFHPYFVVYWGGIVAVTWVDRILLDNETPTLRGFLRHANPILLGGGILIYFGVGSTTWMRFSLQHDLDPFEWLRRDVILDVAWWAHFGFVRSYYRLFAGAIIILAIIAVIKRAPRTTFVIAAGPLLVMLVAAALAFLVSWISFRTNYWILKRQWVASLTIMPVAVFLLIARLNDLALAGSSAVTGWRMAVSPNFPTAAMPALLVAVSVLAAAQARVVLPVEFHPASEAAMAGGDFADGDVAMTAANRLLAEGGGSVAPAYLRYYCALPYISGGAGVTACYSTASRR